MRKIIAISPGDPAGIGPDIVLSAAHEIMQIADAQPLVFADIHMLEARAKQLNININIQAFDNQTIPTKQNTLFCHHIPLAVAATAGELSPANAGYILQCLEQATRGCINKDYAALVTGPINKAVINQGGVDFSGHTEFLAELDQNQTVMMLASDVMRVALATTHLPLHAVSDAISEESLRKTIHILNNDLQTKFAIDKPNILVLGLNPHAGENGYLGKEEIEIITPTLHKLRHQGILCDGPVPADTAFSEENLNHYDAILAMYHDQGLPVLKYSGFHHSINITLGLSFIRTSVDHGTAHELAGTGTANCESLIAAYKTAVSMQTI